MKLLSIAIPCYNSAAYMDKCINSLLPGGEEVEILIVDDGSFKDDTARIADEYAEKYPNIIKAIHKPNGGHGSAVNTGIANATGRYFKVVDSDDWVDAEAYRKVLDILRDMTQKDEELDMLVCNYVYEKEGEKHKAVMNYRHILPKDQVFSWKDCKHFAKAHYILMHSVIYRTQVLRENGVKLPEHTFYVDNIYVFEPLRNVEKMYYLDVDFYRYYIGRADQSVNESVMISRLDQQIKVNKCMIDYLVEHKEELQQTKRRFQYMRNYLEIITCISSVLCIRAGGKEKLAEKKALWQYMKEKDLQIYRRLRYAIMGVAMNLPGRVGRFISITGYRVCQKIFNFN